MMINFLVNTAALLAVLSSAYFAMLCFSRLQAFLAGRQLMEAALFESISVMENPKAPQHARTLAGRLALLAISQEALRWFARHHAEIAVLTGKPEAISESERKLIDRPLTIVAMLCMFNHPTHGGLFRRTFKRNLQKRSMAARASEISRETICATKERRPEVETLAGNIGNELMLAVA